MNKLAEYKAQLRARKARKLGMSLDQFDAYVIQEQRRLDDIHQAKTDREYQFSVLTNYACTNGRIFIIKG